MAGNELFAVIFIFTAMVGAYTCIFLDLGGHKILANKIVELIDSRNKKKKDI